MDHGLRRRRVAEAIAAAGLDALLVTHLPNARYLTGFSGSNGQVVLGADPERSVFLTDGRYTEQSRLEVPDLERRTYPERARGGGGGRLCRPRRSGGSASRAPACRTRRTRELPRPHPLEFVPVAGAVERERLTKDAEERAAICARASLCRRGLRACRSWAVACARAVTERELALALEIAMRRAGADDRAFGTIVAFGENGAEPHHHPTDRPLARGDVVKIDFGALADGYHSDMTRTVAFGEPPARLRELRDLVAAAQAAGIDAVRAGVPAQAVDGAARRVVAEAGLRRGVPPRARAWGRSGDPRGAAVALGRRLRAARGHGRHDRARRVHSRPRGRPHRGHGRGDRGRVPRDPASTKELVVL